MLTKFHNLLIIPTFFDILLKTNLMLVIQNSEVLNIIFPLNLRYFNLWKLFSRGLNYHVLSFYDVNSLFVLQ